MFCAVIAAGLNFSQRSQDGVRLNRPIKESNALSKYVMSKPHVFISPGTWTRRKHVISWKNTDVDMQGFAVDLERSKTRFPFSLRNLQVSSHSTGVSSFLHYIRPSCECCGL